jgi:quinol monooxygenase YgiN
MQSDPDLEGAAAAIELHLRITVAPGRRGEFLAFLARATPFYEQPGGIRIRLLQDAADDHRFIEVVEYDSPRVYQRDQERVASDPTMKSYLDTWRSLLAGPPAVEVYRLIPARPPASTGLAST